MARVSVVLAVLTLLAMGSAGAEDLFAPRVLPPWTPVEASGDQVRVWNRGFEFAGEPVPAAISSAGEPLLAGPASLQVVVGGAPAQWRAGEVEAAEPTRWRRASRAAVGDCALAATTTIEFDGLCRVDLELRPQGPVRIDRLELRVPLRPEVAGLYTHHVLGAEPVRSARWDLRRQPQRQWWAGALPAEGLRLAFTPQVWLGSTARGLAWLCETPAGWSPPDAADALRVERGTDSIDLVVGFIGTPLELAGPLTYTFALMPTPVKPWSEELANTRIAHSAAGGPEEFRARFLTPGVWAQDGVTGHLRGDVTLAAWVRPGGSAGLHEIMGNAAFDLYRDGDAGTLVLELRDSLWGLHRIEAPWRPEPGRWYHVAATRDGDWTRLWIDGAPVAEERRSFEFMSVAHLPLMLGSNAWQSRPWDGALDEVALLRRALSVGELRALMGGALPDDAEQSVAGMWSFDAPPDGLVTVGVGPERLALRFRPRQPAPDYAPSFAAGVRGQAFVVSGDSAEVTGNRAGLTGLQYLRAQGVDVLLLWSNWSDIWGYPGIGAPAYRQFFREFLDAAHAAGLRVIPYISIDIVAVDEPDLEAVAAQILREPRTPFKRGDRVIGYAVDKSEAFARYYAEKLAEFAREYPIDGIYMDGGGLSGTLDTEEEDVAPGAGGPADAVVRYSVFGGRELMRRVASIFHGGERDDGLILTHASTPFVCSQQGFTDVHLTGELHFWLALFRGLTRAAGSTVAQRWPPGLAQAWFTGETFGVPMYFTGKHRNKQYTDGTQRLPRAAIFGDDELSALTALHGAAILGPSALRSPTGLDDCWWAARERIGRSATWEPYWRNAGLVRSAPDGVLASLWRAADGAVLVLLVSTADGAVEAQAELLPACGPGPWRVEWSTGPATVTLAGARLTARLEPGQGVYALVRPVR